MNDPDRIQGISVVCVFNDAAVRRNCLDRSIEAYSGPVSVDFIAVDNTRHEFSTAGGALNYGARSAKHDVVVFVHQDVYLHSLGRIADAAAFLLDGTWSMLGANGVTPQGESVGRLRDRVQLIGNSSWAPTAVDSLDEVLFMVRRDLVLDSPLTEDTSLAWHAYAVEYGLRVKSKGHQVGALNMAITHNSLTINLDRLDVAHRRIAQLYPDATPIATTCGRIGQNATSWRRLATLSGQGWRLRWLRESGVARRLSKELPVRIVLADIRHDVDLLGYPTEPIHLFNLDELGGFAEYDTRQLRLQRRDRPILCSSSLGRGELVTQLDGLAAECSWLITNISLVDLQDFRDHIEMKSCIAGVQGNGIWLAGGPFIRNLPDLWVGARATPMLGRVQTRSAESQSWQSRHSERRA